MTETPPLKLDSVEGARAARAWVCEEKRSGKMDKRKANCLIFLTNTLISVLRFRDRAQANNGRPDRG